MRTTVILDRHIVLDFPIDHVWRIRLDNCGLNIIVIDKEQKIMVLKGAVI